MRTLTLKDYASECKISIQAAHKRIKVKELNKKKYPEIVGVTRLNGNFHLLKVNDSKGLTNKRNKVAKIDLV